MKQTILVIAAAVAVYSVVQAADYAAWAWWVDLPAQLAVAGPPSSRTAVAIDEMFHSPRPTPTVEEVIALLGRPDGYSPQFMYSKRQGSAKPSSGGTLRFILEDGGEVHIWSGDLRHIGLAIRYDRKGRGTLLYK